LVWTNQNIILFHGTNSVAFSGITAKGCFDLSLCRDDTDFGSGLYTTTNKTQAEEWARRSSAGLNRRHRTHPESTPHLIAFNVEREAIAQLTGLFFVRANPDYWNLVEHCRMRGDHTRSGPARWYDLIAGPVSTLPFRETIIEDFDQISFHTPDACIILYNSML